MHAAAVALPAHKSLAEEAQRDECELQAEPIVLEPEKQVGAENNWEGAEANDIRFAPRPRQQHVEGIGEEQLTEKKRREIINGRPIPSPIRVHAELTKALNVVLRPR